MAGSRAYDWMYRWWAPWDAVGVRPDLLALLGSGRVTPSSHPRSVDLGCGTGANVVHLAAAGFDSWGVDFSPVALAKARSRAEEAGVSPTFVEGDLTSDPGVRGPFDLIIDFGTLDDLRPERRPLMASTVTGLARPGSVFLEWCFYGRREDLPFISFNGPSRLSPTIEPGELEELFGGDWDIEPFSSVPERFVACFLLVKR